MPGIVVDERFLTSACMAVGASEPMHVFDPALDPALKERGK